MNIFDSLKEYRRPNYDIFNFKGEDIYKAIRTECSEYVYPCSDPYEMGSRFEQLVAILRARAIKYRYSNNKEPFLTFKDLVFDICSNNKVQAKEILVALEEAVDIDSKIQEREKQLKEDMIRLGADREKTSELKLNINWNIEWEDIEDITSLDIIQDESCFTEFVNLAFDFKETCYNKYIDYIIEGFVEPIYFDRRSIHHELTNEELDILNEMKIYKSRIMDIIQKSDHAYRAIDVYNRFKDGEVVSTEQSWVLEQKHSDMSVFVIY